MIRILYDNNKQFPIEHIKLRVLLEKENNCIRDYYDRPISGYPRVAQTIEYIQRNFVFLNIRQKVLEYIKRCDSYNKNKALRHTKYSNLEFRDPLW